MRRLGWLVVSGSLSCGSPTAPLAPEFRPVRTLSLPSSVTIESALVTRSSGNATTLRLMLHNAGSGDQEIVYGLCTFSVVSYDNPDRRGLPVWHALFPDGCVFDIGLNHTAPGTRTSELVIGTLPEEAQIDPGSGSPRYAFLVIQLAGERALRVLRVLSRESLSR